MNGLPADAENGNGGFTPSPPMQVALSMASVALAMFLAALSQTIVATTLPVIVADLGGFDRYSWAATSYMVTATVAYPIVGRLSDLYGRRPFLILGAAVFAAGSVLVGSSQSMTQVIAFRAVQGIGGGIIMACSWIAIADLFQPEDRGRFHGLLSAVYGVASIVGPILGGFASDHLSWKWSFLLLAPMSIAVLLLIIWVYPRRTSAVQHPGRRKVDLPGMAALASAATSIMLALSAGGVQYPWSSPQILGLLAFGLALAVVFVRIEVRSDSPIMPLSIYSNRVVCIALAVTALSSVGLYAILVFLPLFFQAVLDLSATASGGLLVPMLLGMVAGGFAGGQLLSSSRLRYRVLALSSTGCLAAGTALITTFDSSTSTAFTQVSIVLAGMGFGGMVVTFSVAVQNLVPYGQVGIATSALQFYRSLGGLLGLAVMGAVLARGFAARLDKLVPDDIVSLLPESMLEALRHNPKALVDRTEAAALSAELAKAGPEGVSAASVLLDSLDMAMVGALTDVFVAAAALTALSFVVCIFFRQPTNTNSNEGYGPTSRGT